MKRPMSRRPGAVLAAVAVALAVLGTPGISQARTSAAPKPKPKPAADRMAAEQMSKKFGVSQTEAKRRVDRQPTQFKLADQMRKTLGGNFGGAWLDQQNGGRLTVGVTSGAATPQVRSAAAAKNLGDTATVPVRYAYQHLEQVNAKLAKWVAAANKGTKNGLQTGITTPDNVVKLNTLQGTKPTAAQQRVLKRAKAEFGGAVKVGTYAHRSVPRYCQDDYACDPPLRSGLAIFTGGARCTSAFNVYSGGTYYILTAGHCAELGYWWDVSTYSYGYQNIGGAGYYTFGWDGDSALINVGDPGWWQPRGWVLYESPVYGSEADYVGGYVCKQGSTTGYTCGTVSEVNSTVSYPNRTLSGMTWSDACDGPGDSGSGVFAGNYAHGVLSGGTDTGCGMIHEPIGRALSTWGVSLLTG